METRDARVRDTNRRTAKKTSVMRHTRLARADRGSTQSGFSVPRPSRSAPTAAAAAAPNRRDPRGDGFASFADAPRASLFALVRRISPRLRSSASVCGAIHRNHARESGSRPTSVARACQLGRPRFACSARKYAEKLFAKTRQRAAGSWNHTSVSYADGARGGRSRRGAPRTRTPARPCRTREGKMPSRTPRPGAGVAPRRRRHPRRGRPRRCPCLRPVARGRRSTPTGRPPGTRPEERGPDDRCRRWTCPRRPRRRPRPRRRTTARRTRLTARETRADPREGGRARSPFPTRADAPHSGARRERSARRTPRGGHGGTPRPRACTAPSAGARARQ